MPGIDARFSGGFTLAENMGVGNQTAGERGVLAVGRTASQEGTNFPHIQLANSNGSVNHSIMRWPADGDHLTLASQGGTGFYFNGPIKATDFYYLTAHSVTDAVVNDGDATVTSATGGFTAAMVNAVVILADDEMTHITTVLSRTSTNEIELTAACPFTATSVRLVISYFNGVIDTTWPGSLEGIVFGAVGSTCRDTVSGDFYRKTTGGGSPNGWTI